VFQNDASLNGGGQALESSYKRRQRSRPIVIVTAYMDDDDRFRAQAHAIKNRGHALQCCNGLMQSGGIGRVEQHVRRGVKAEPQAQAAGQRPHSCHRLAAFLDLMMKLRQVGMGEIRRQIRSHAVHAYALGFKIEKNIPKMGQTDREMGIILPAAAVVAAQARSA